MDRYMYVVTASLKEIRLDSGKIVCGVFLDLQRAFDTVHHNILLHKLFNYGVRGISMLAANIVNTITLI